MLSVMNKPLEWAFDEIESSTFVTVKVSLALLISVLAISYISADEPSSLMFNSVTFPLIVMLMVQLGLLMVKLRFNFAIKAKTGESLAHVQLTYSKARFLLELSLSLLIYLWFLLVLAVSGLFIFLMLGHWLT